MLGKRSWCVALLGLPLLVCQCANQVSTSISRGGGRSDAAELGGSSGSSGGAGGVLGTGGAPNVGTGGDPDSGGITGSGGAGVAADAACTVLEDCRTGQGGRGNICGGVIADARFLYGSGFEAYEGARVVSRSGQGVIENGTFKLYIGVFAGCGLTTTAYRIETSPNGRCDTADHVYLTDGQSTGVDPSVTGASPGVAATCAEFDSGLDLELTVSTECLPSCGSLRCRLFDAAGAILADDTFFLDGPPLSGHAFSGALVQGQTYTFKYYHSPNSFVSACSGTTDVWERTFTASDGVNSAELSLRDASSQGDCF